MTTTQPTKPKPIPKPEKGTGKARPPKPNEIDLVTLIDDHIENSKGPRKGSQKG